MKSTAKVLPMKKTSKQAPAPAEFAQDGRCVVMDGLRDELGQARTVLAVAQETWNDDQWNKGRDEDRASCVAVLELVDYKLANIEEAAQDIAKPTKQRRA